MWFLEQFSEAFHEADSEGVVVISDREKGLPAALEKAMPNVTQSYCCQHIADNVQQRFGIKCRPLFWAVAQARSTDAYEEALQALMS
jgi:transposase-like protein